MQTKGSAAKRYCTGRRVEYAVRNKLKTLGWPFVMRAAGSKGLVDILAIAPGMIILVQVKSGGAAMTKAERRELCRIACMIDAIPILAERRKDGLRWYETTPNGGLLEMDAEELKVL